jgi:ATP-dependent RNA circularization protein (DNA/RNA ligase family)
MAAQYDVETKLEKTGLGNVAIQGEVIGEGIQGNPYKITGQQFHVFDVYDIDEGEYYDATERRAFIINIGLTHAPVIDISMPFLSSVTVDDLLLMAEGKSQLNNKTEAEGLVFKCNEKPELSFKAISNKF